MKPLIGVITSMELEQDSYYTTTENVKAILGAGGIPIMLPYFQDELDLHTVAETIDGLYATGGYDIDPTIFGEEPHPMLGTIIPDRDSFEIKLMKKMLEADKPILGVCRGSQTLNIALGGDMYQDIYAQKEGDLLQHQQGAPKEHGSHFVEIVDGSLLNGLVGKARLKVNSRHHQANQKVVEPLQICAKAADGVVEAIESTEHKFVLAVQWHPENMLVTGDEASKAIFRGFINACKWN
ncbi:gamma-glutamyl-gamma-aminobutyrate hydrolase family protein [Ornithinibacillus scapharcae]|uniref:gamma-glutamyl-gamma-aminobutyrate hydrolase family protein n=1 Tax=Ornithinibacillus scapharcae TaxID=1147159 RepID=UPI000225AD66|nr:gamma-glutamyl-gamma-aminobutyrate hydrolase family protein [Ornithinibacillus scapharcae]